MRASKVNLIKVYPACEYPAQWDDLIDQDKKVIATIYTLEEGLKDKRKEGITKAKDGIYDMVVLAKEINNEVVKNALEKLGRITRKEYKFMGKRSEEDKIITFAEKLMRPLAKYGDQKKGYDFSKIKAAKEKAKIIGIWIGEILYEAITHKDVEAVKSLTEIILTEIEDLIKQ